MIKFESIKLKFRKYYINKTAKLRKKNLCSSDFTIISNNCWGGFIYQSYGVSYNSPTIGLYFMAEDYIKFISNLEKNINSKLEFISPKDSKHYDVIKNDKKIGEYPIGKINDIEIIFLHYSSEEEAYDKWNRRCKRINWDKLLIKFNDQNGCTKEHLCFFDRLDIKNKICFTSSKKMKLKSTIFIPSFKKQKSIYASQEPFGKSRYVNINKIINSL